MRRTLARHLALALAVMVALSALVTFGLWRLAEDQASRTAERVARQVATAVIVPLSDHDFVRPGGFDRADLLEHLSPFLESGMVERVKVFTVDGDTGTVAFSDEPRVEGLTTRLDPRLVGDLGAGQVLVHAVPMDQEHQYENSLGGSRMEVFFGFHDAGGNEARLELYVPVDVGAMTAHSVIVLLPLVLAGLILLTAAMTPFSVAVARRVERDRAEAQAARRYALTAADTARRDVARHLHDNVIPDLAAAGLLIDRLRTGDHLTGTAVDGRPLLDRAHHLVTTEVGQLRGLLDELQPSASTDASLDNVLYELVARLRRADTARTTPIVDIRVTWAGHLDEQTAAVLHAAAGELLRNAFRHAAATYIHVTAGPADGVYRPIQLTVADDGVGFDPDHPRHTPGHMGLRLVSQAVADRGGSLILTSTRGAGSTATVTLPSARTSRSSRRRPD